MFIFPHCFPSNSSIPVNRAALFIKKQHAGLELQVAKTAILVLKIKFSTYLCNYFLVLIEIIDFLINVVWFINSYFATVKKNNPILCDRKSCLCMQ